MIGLFTKRERIIFYGVIIMIAVIIIFNTLGMPILNRNNLLNKDINVTRTKLQKYLQLLAEKSIIEKRYAELSSVLGVRESQDDTAVVALSELESLAKNANIKIVEIRPESGTGRANSKKEFLINLRTSGNMEGHLKFIYDLENSPSLLTIKKLQLSAKSGAQALEGSFSISQVLLAE